ncbi:MAG: ABC transporter ATP-binding protein, partial [Thermoplasmataceae archaeon]
MSLRVEGLHCNRGSFSLDEISFEVEDGTVFTIGGPNGAGKTTLINALYGHIRPLRGRITINGNDISKMSPSQVSRLVSVVSQEIPEPFNFTVRDVVSISGYSKAIENISVEDALEKCGIPDLIDRQFAELSGGEKRLVMIAAAIHQEAAMVVMDEPTAFLDVDKEQNVIRIIRNLRDDGKTVIISLHDINLIYNLSDRVILLKSGRIKYSGDREEVLTESNLL